MCHEPLCTALRPKIDPAGRHIPISNFCRGARCGFVSKACSRQGGLAALRCILRHVACKALISGMRRMDRASPSLKEVKHV